MELDVASGSLLRSSVLRLKTVPGLDTVNVELQEAQQTPELLQRVLQRSPSQQESMVRVDGGQDVVKERVFVLQPGENLFVVLFL